MTKIEDFNGTVTKQVIDSRKLSFGSKIRTLTISDLHGYVNDRERAKRLGETIKSQEPDVIFIAGDLFNGGKPWGGGRKVESFRKFVQNISEAAPVFVSLGNHDLIGMNSRNENKRLGNFRNLDSVRPGKVFPLYNEKIIIEGMEVIGYVPRLELMTGEGLKKQIHGVAHDEFIHDYKENGAKFDNIPGIINVYLGHDPHLIAASENGVGLGDLSLCDFFVTGHLHDGYKPVIEWLDKKKKSLTGKGFKSIDPVKSLEFDRGWTYQPGTIVDKNGIDIPRHRFPLYFGQINLCRGIIYLDNDAQQHFLQMPDGKFYKNASDKANTQIWVPVTEKIARETILDSNLHFMLISEGVTPGFSKNENLVTMNVVDIVGAEGKKARRK